MDLKQFKIVIEYYSNILFRLYQIYFFTFKNISLHHNIDKKDSYFIIILSNY